MLEKIAKIVARYNEIERRMADPEVLADYQKIAELAQERSDLEPLVEAYRRHETAVRELAEARELLETADDEDMTVMAREEIERLEALQQQLEKQMRSFLVPKDPRDEKNVFIEIRAGAGGDEAGIFAADLLRLYMRYAETRGWKTEIVDENSTGVGGYKEVILAVKGKGAYSRFKYESGVHRVQRVPVTESQGRIHTSTATVAVMPEVQDVDIDLDERELEITSTFSSGPGGQHMQKNATAIRIVHKPTGITVKVQSERSQTQNKRLAMGIIQARLQEMEEEKQHAAVAADRRAQVGTGDRSEKIRTYNYPQGRVTDHRVGFTSYNLPVVMGGDLDPFIDALTIADEAARLAAASENGTGKQK
ncbi:MAG: peptide chain release factor 1 [Chloroflexi bacterium]|nr:peptide chain release factor 1 [Chloroflexota bacterium]MCI0577649.1 peptide chain release factor 1 [Chloroflexota bacterium]MCI0644866.1 peptide chain release factor 1 [Chloroflexota bacterium]MCI0731397.1 peptide chain release factor 1 [Chloroflexota bacterium]